MVDNTIVVTSETYPTVEDYKFACKNMEYRQKNGQLMGNPISFPVLCWANYLCYHLSWELYCERQCELFTPPPVLINGDDIGFSSGRDFAKVWREFLPQFGFEPSLGKNFETSKFLQLNSELWMRSIKDGRPIPFKVGYVNFGIITGRKKQDCTADLTISSVLKKKKSAEEQRNMLKAASIWQDFRDLFKNLTNCMLDPLEDRDEAFNWHTMDLVQRTYNLFIQHRKRAIEDFLSYVSDSDELALISNNVFSLFPTQTDLKSMNFWDITREECIRSFYDLMTPPQESQFLHSYESYKLMEREIVEWACPKKRARRVLKAYKSPFHAKRDFCYFKNCYKNNFKEWSLQSDGWMERRLERSKASETLFNLIETETWLLWKNSTIYTRYKRFPKSRMIKILGESLSRMQDSGILCMREPKYSSCLFNFQRPDYVFGRKDLIQVLHLNPELEHHYFWIDCSEGVTQSVNEEQVDQHKEYPIGPFEIGTYVDEHQGSGDVPRANGVEEREVHYKVQVSYKENGSFTWDLEPYYVDTYGYTRFFRKEA